MTWRNRRKPRFWPAEPDDQNYLERHPEGETCHFIRPDWKLPRRADSLAT